MSLAGKIMTMFTDKDMTAPAFPRTKVQAISDDDGVGLNVLLDKKQSKHTSQTIALKVEDWVNNAQQVTVYDMSIDSTIIVSSDPSNIQAYGDCGVYCAQQLDGALKFVCTKTPLFQLKVNLLILD